MSDCCFCVTIGKNIDFIFFRYFRSNPTRHSILIGKDAFIMDLSKERPETWQDAYRKIRQQQGCLPALSLRTLSSRNTVLIIMDMVNGFVNHGALASPRVKKIQPKINGLQRLCSSSGIFCLAFCDCHDPESPEFRSFPVHCLRGTEESALTEEVLKAGVDLIVEKNSTNGFLEPSFQRWLTEHPQISNFLIVGDCTDLCVMHFAISLKTDFNRRNQTSRVVVPIQMVETYDLGCHDAELANTMALYQMSLAGVELVSQIIE